MVTNSAWRLRIAGRAIFALPAITSMAICGDAYRPSTPTIITSLLPSAAEPKISFGGSSVGAARERDFRHDRRRHTTRPRTSASGAQPAQNLPEPALQAGANSPTSATVI